MIIKSVRLKNIKSYGEGAAGEGITVGFQSGINRVAGRNGHGKTTLIEALGYGLFFCEPEFEEAFKLPIYFLRAGEKEGLIEVVFEHEGIEYRVERGVGQNKVRSKLIQLSDNSTCAHDDAEVAANLCRLLGFKSQKHLSDLFANLIGVKQGRLAWPFDSKPSAAKIFFEPLLDVTIFRESNLRLGDAQGRFRELLEKQSVELATIEERIRERADSQQNVPVKEAQLEASSLVLEKSRRQKEQVQKLKQDCEQKQTAFASAKNALDAANAALGLARHKLETSQQRVNEASAAAETVQKTKLDFEAYNLADENLRKLQRKQSEKGQLQQERSRVAQAAMECEGKARAAKQQAGNFAEQKEERTRRAQELAKQLEALQKRLDEGKAGFDLLAEGMDALRRSSEALEAWRQKATLAVRKCGLAESFVDWEKVVFARSEERRLEAAALDQARQVATGQELKRSLAKQLEQISGGVCPFLKEKCQQFDPAKVRSELAEQESVIARLIANREASSQAHQQAKQQWDKLAEARAREFEKQKIERVRWEQDLENKRKDLAAAQSEIRALELKIDRQNQEAIAAETKAGISVREVAALDEKLKAFAELEKEIHEQQGLKEKAAPGHQQYLGMKSIADKIGEYRDALKQAGEAEAHARELVARNLKEFEQANLNFDPATLDKARNDLGAADVTLDRSLRDWKRVEEDLKSEKERLRQWKQACLERDRIGAETGRLNAANSLARFAAKVLKDTAPAVAQHLCSRIASSAQRLFNQISQETIDLEWKAEPHYSLRISPGDRRFAMLSGGEQTKLALAMTLAMIQEFSGLRFAVFDEPTYAVDGESRQKLADAIVDVQKASGLDQLIVVSHDDSFEGKIEHVILLNKRAGAGTEVMMAD